MPLEPPVDENLVQRLPLPLAQLYRRAHNAKTALDRHLTAFYLWEAALKLLGCAAVVAYAGRPEHDPQIAEKLQNLARPSLGHWWDFVRTLLPLLADSGVPGFAPLRDALLGNARDDCPRAAGLHAALREALEGQAGQRATVRFSEFFDRLVRYRNREIGHGAAGRRPADFHQRMGSALLAGAGEVLGKLDVLAGRRLLYVGEVEQKGGRWLVQRYELIGEAARRVASLDLPREAAARLPDGDRVYLDDSTADGLDGLTALHPLLLYDAEAVEVLFLNSRRGRQRTEYLGYSSGRTAERADLGGEQRALLARVLGMAVAEEQAAQWATRSQGEEPPEEAPAGTVRRYLGEFELLSEVGHGGMGVVYRAWQPSLGRQVALKKLLHAGDAKTDARFRREIRALGRVEHPHLVKVFTSGSDGDQWFYAMELVEGAPLSAVCDRLRASTVSVSDVDLAAWQATLSTVCEEARRQEKPLGGAPAESPAPADKAKALASALPQVGRSYVRQVVELMRQVSEAAHALHEAGILHRDVKPGNVLVTADGTQAMLVDLGLAQLADDVEGRLTRTRQFVGTLRYASPQQVLAVGQLDRRTDVYSLGGTLWELLALRPLFGATEQTPTPELMEKIQREEPERLRRLHPGLSRDLEAIVHRCLEKDPARRYPTAAELARDLERYQRGEPVRARPVRNWERGWKWVKRRPGAAALVGVTVLMVLALVAGGVSLFYSGEVQGLLRTSEQQRDIAKQERDKADRQRGIAEEQRARADGLLDVNRIALAEREIDKSNFGRAAEVLDDCRWDQRRWEWAHFRRAALLVHSLEGHTGSVHGVCFSPDGLRLASASGDQTVRLWDAATGQETATLKGHTAWVGSVCFSPDGRRLASASADKTVRVWQAATGTELCTLNGHTEVVYGVCFSPDGRRLASASHDKTVRVWDAATGTEQLTLTGHTEIVHGVCFSPDGRRLASASWDRTVKVWDAATGQETATLKGHTKYVDSVCFSPDGLRLASASSDGTVKMWDAATGKVTATLTGHRGPVVSVCFSPDGHRLASASTDRTVKVWDAVTGQETATLKAHTAAVGSVCFNPDGRRLASASYDGTAKVWDAPAGQETATLEVRNSPVHSVCFSPDGRRLAGSASGDPAMTVWDAATLQETATVKGQVGAVHSVCFSPDGRRLASASADKTVRVWDAAIGTQQLTLNGHTGAVHSVCFSPDGRRLASASADKTVRVWDAATGMEQRTLQGHTGEVQSVCFSPDGRRLASASSDDTVKVWDAATGQETATLKGHTGAVQSVCFSPDGRRLASASWDYTVKLWDAVTGQEEATLKGHTDCVQSVCFSPDGRRLASASWDNTVKLWDAATFQEITTLTGHTDWVYSVCFRPDGGRLASASADRTVKLWDARPNPDTLTLKFAARVESVGFNADGRRVVARAGTVVKAWDAATGAAVEPCNDPPPPPDQREAHSPDGKMTAWANGTRVQVLRAEQWQRKQEADAEIGREWRGRQAAECEQARDWFAAAFHLERLLRAEPNNAAYHDRHGRALAEQGRWAEAANEFARAGELDANDVWHPHRQAWALLAGGDQPGYRRVCARLLKDFGDSPDASAAIALAYTAALSADSGLDPNRLVERAKVSVKADPDSYVAQRSFAIGLADGAVIDVKPDPYSHPALRMLGGALYRAGDDKAAVEALEKAVELHQNGGSAWVQLFLAMAHHRLGNADKARHWLDRYDREGWNYRATALFGASPANPLSAVGLLAIPTAELPDGGDFWEVRLARRVLRREAEAVLRQKSDARP